jgi:hypothetical protein
MNRIEVSVDLVCLVEESSACLLEHPFYLKRRLTDARIDTFSK